MTDLTPRKRDGVYYTPEWVSALLVDATLGLKLAELRREFAGSLAAHASRVESLTVLDPACGTGAFLIPALARLMHERRWIARERGEDIDDAELRAKLSSNLVGIDIDAEAVAATQRALGGGGNLRVGNSLVDFNWASEFPAVFERGGFDCILANPPYVKFQHLRRVDPATAEFLRTTYTSAATGNFDLYLPFLEQSIRLLNPGGRMGAIAPSLWIKQAYGERLRTWIRTNQSLERWLDLGDFQVFEDATTYTALQFFVGWRSATIRVARRSGGERIAVDWDGADVTALEYTDLPARGAWAFVAADELALIRRLQAAHPALSEHVKSISVGVQTSADKIFHLQEVGPGCYRNGLDREPWDLEPTLIRPLVAGIDVRRHAMPSSNRRILFPYREHEGKVELMSARDLANQAPQTWRYLETHAPQLRRREHGKFDDERWYRFGRNQNIDKQHLAKLLIPRLVQRLVATPDLDGTVVADNVDVGYLIPREESDLWYLTGVLGSAVADFIFRRTSRPFRGGYLSANKQVIAPLPVPRPSPTQKQQIARLAARLWQAPAGTIDPIALAHELDAAVFELYGLAESEVALVSHWRP